MMDILVMFTKPELVVQDGEEMADASSSCWCLMLQELFKHSLSAPHVSQLIVLGDTFVLVSIDNLVIIMCLSSDALVTQILVFSSNL